MLNSNISTSISGWFSQLSSSKEAEKTEDKNDENVKYALIILS